MYQLPEFLKFPKLFHAISDVSDGNMSFQWGKEEEVSKNRMVFLKKMGIRIEDCIGTSLDHKIEVTRVTSAHRGAGMCQREGAVVGDAFFIDTPSAFLFLLTGDCLPVIFYDPVHAVAGLAHVSRHNTPQFFMKEILKKMKEWHGSNPRDVIIGIGPGVRKESYVFTRAVCEILTPVWKEFAVARQEGSCALDIVGWNVAQLMCAGVQEGNISIAPYDTINDVRFFSHYRSNNTGESEGRFTTVIGLQ
ncbi:MAG: polyphenol oxidase family protein [Patescibacteria group bacterium]|nr:polyphenol oxidase family protein [Patescibacteria group bacterium]